MKYKIDEYPMGSFKGQKTPGKYMDGILYDNLKILAEVIHKDLTFLGILSSSTLEVGTGKTQTKGSLILMGDGSWKKVEDIKIGDTVISPNPKNGKATIETIKETHTRFEKDCYDVINKNNGEVLYSCAGNHDVYFHQNRRHMINGQRKTFSEHVILEAKELALKNDTWLRNESTAIIQGFKIKQFTKSNATIKPYFLGVYLGDGSSDNNKTRISNSNKEVMKEVNKDYEKMCVCIDKRNCALTHTFSKQSEPRKQLEKYKLIGKKSGTKFIPRDCLTSDYNYRLQLLAGLIDTDGTLDHRNGLISYSTKSKKLAIDIQELVRSLGGNASINPIIKKIKSRDFIGNYFTISINLGKDTINIPLKNKFKLKKLRKLTQPKNRIGFKVIPSKSRQVYGFEITGESKLYITDNYCITHNSVLAQQIGEVWTDLVNKKYNLNIPFTMNNVVFKPQDLIRRSFDIPKYSCIILDEWEDVGYWTALGTSLREFFRKCRQLNLFMLIIIPNYFQLPMNYAISRSVFFIDVKFEGKFERGYFDFYNFKDKKNLYLKGKKTQNYGVWQPSFYGRFPNGYAVPEKEYRRVKLQDMVKSEDKYDARLEKEFVLKKIIEGYNKGISADILMKVFNIPQTTFYRYIQKGKKTLTEAEFVAEQIEEKNKLEPQIERQEDGFIEMDNTDEERYHATET